ncbi:chemotaxis protein CheD [Bacillus sp. RG28]|uniref:Probable chemoreceptor glutamine deamidase CheD n=1 Tax=Gottfriedia endophytica TaxID=2820819 RepID=A0A940NP54_9BACI|nr:chemotaxis protein CheD [Gottfriedia endophytica]MBP0726216.1 chemotaxis protein CheD [Gottfriedia endophytica]
MDKTEQLINIGIAELGVVKGNQVIRTCGLGSCVGVVVFDGERKIAGMVHIMLPDSGLARDNHVNEAKFADTGINALVEKVVLSGGRRSSLKAKLAGGAQMFQFSSSSDTMRIGPRNVEAVLQQLEKLQIQVLGSDVGGSKGRTIEFSPDNSLLNIKIVSQGVIII